MSSTVYVICKMSFLNPSPMRHFQIFFLQLIPLQCHSLDSNKLFCIYVCQSISHHIKECKARSEITFITYARQIQTSNTLMLARLRKYNSMDLVIQLSQTQNQSLACVFVVAPYNFIMALCDVETKIELKKKRKKTLSK